MALRVVPPWQSSALHLLKSKHKVGELIKKTWLNCQVINLVVASGLEPPTPTLSGWCSNRLSYNPILNFICVKLTFAPFCNFTSAKNVKRRWCACKMGINLGSKFVVEVIGFEPMTPCLQGRCSSQLSYTPTECSNILTK